MPDGVFGEGRLVRWTLIALAVGFLVAVAAVGGVGKGGSGEEVAGFGGGVAGERDAVGREEEAVGLVNAGLVGRVRWDCVVGALGGADGGPEKQAGSREGHDAEKRPSGEAMHGLFSLRGEGGFRNGGADRARCRTCSECGIIVAQRWGV